MMGYGYPDLHGQFGWKIGVHMAPAGYEHPWLVVLPTGTSGAWSRAEARAGYREWRATINMGKWADAR
jgi:hypothetical protein